MLLKVVNFIVGHWQAIVAVGTAIWTIYQEFRLQVLQKSSQT